MLVSGHPVSQGASLAPPKPGTFLQAGSKMAEIESPIGELFTMRIQVQTLYPVNIEETPSELPLVRKLARLSAIPHV